MMMIGQNRYPRIGLICHIETTVGKPTNLHYPSFETRVSTGHRRKKNVGDKKTGYIPGKYLACKIGICQDHILGKVHEVTNVRMT